MNNKKSIISAIISVSFIVLFALWTIIVKTLDYKPIGPNGTSVGLATINEYFHNLTGANHVLYVLTDWCGVVAIAVMLGYLVLGIFEWVKRKSILKVDYSLIVLGVYYIVVFAFYALFEYLIINYRPILINGILEASYPSSTTLLVGTVMPTAVLDLNKRIKNTALNRVVIITICVFTALTVIGRLLSGVHWLTDIIGGALLSVGLVFCYNAVVLIKKH